jgi:transcriptional regulator with XRE-family HTH domain
VDTTRIDVAKTFGTVLKKQRRQQGLSQRKLAKLCDLDVTYPSLLERGLRTPTLTVILQLAKGLHMSPSHLVALMSDGPMVRADAPTSARQAVKRDVIRVRGT